jgi:hypothetical protein
MRPAASAWRSLVSFTSEYHHQVQPPTGFLSRLHCVCVLVQNSDVSELITGAMQVQNGVKRFLQGNQLLTPLSADKLAWITVSSPVGCQLWHM